MDKHKALPARYSEGYGTEEDCLLSDPQGDSDADADIEDTDSRLQEGSPLQRMSSRRRRRQRIARQDTTESDDDGGRSQRAHHWSLRLSPHPARDRTILEESVSQVRPLVLCRPCGEAGQGAPSDSAGNTAGRWVGRWVGHWTGQWACPWAGHGLYSLPLWPLLLIPPLSVIILMVLLLPQTPT